jgi:hypothetical protein
VAGFIVRCASLSLFLVPAHRMQHGREKAVTGRMFYNALAT